MREAAKKQYFVLKTSHYGNIDIYTCKKKLAYIARLCPITEMEGGGDVKALADANVKNAIFLCAPNTCRPKKILLVKLEKM